MNVLLITLYDYKMLTLSQNVNIIINTSEELSLHLKRNFQLQYFNQIVFI